MNSNPRISGCGCAWSHERGGLIVLEKVLSQLPKRSVVVVENVTPHCKQFYILGYDIAGIKVNHFIVGDLWMYILVITTRILAGNIL